MITLAFLHNSQSTQFRSPIGAVPANTEITLRIKTQGTSKGGTRIDILGADLRLWCNGEEIIQPMQKDGKFFVTTYTPRTPNIVWYYFIVHTNVGDFFYGNNEESLGGCGRTSNSEPPSFQITVYEPTSAPLWFANSVGYQIFVDRFARGAETPLSKPFCEDYIVHNSWDEPVSENIHHIDFYGGNLSGIIQKLPYLNELGVKTLYLSPIFEGHSNHKYDTGNYEKIDPMFGTEHDFKKLCKQAKKFGMRIVLDGVFNHVGEDSIYFNNFGHYESEGAAQSQNSPYTEWFEFEEYPHKYRSWWGVPSLPQITKNTPQSFIDFVQKILKKWLKLGASGWRLDVVDELPLPLLDSIYATVKEEYGDNIVIGEVWEDASRKESYGENRLYFKGNRLDGTLNYPFRTAITAFLNEGIDVYQFSAQINSILENYPPHNLISCFNLLDGHDVPRALTTFGGNKTRFMNAVIWQMTFFGVPLIYYGDEVGTHGGNDPYNRAPFPWNNADLELFEFYKKLIKLRNENQVLRTGHFELISAKNGTYSYRRFVKDGKDILGKSSENKEFLITISTLQKPQIFEIKKGRKYECI